MSDVQKFPGHRWSPDGEMRVFHTAEDVPEGWTEYHPDSAPKVERQPATSIDLTRKEIVEALNAGNIPFVKNAKTEALYAQLTEAVKAHLAETGVEFDPEASVKSLLELTRPAE